MKNFFARNISRRGRLVRGILAGSLIVAGLLIVASARWWGLALLASGAFVLFEALRGWCLMRACGIKTRW
ncbi:MAG TPA: YgaP-like transmembrane domain [Candidatus Sulfotelmatobacter sp.]|nr:YgaP-like transmembrane domain [Candidatus Sulfotelmatobacter sp.]